MGMTELREAKAQADRIERTTGSSGAVVNTPKGVLLDARDVEAKHPDRRLRWVNLRNLDKVAARVAEGYVRLPDSEDGRHIGDDYALFSLPRGEYEKKIEAGRQLRALRLRMHKTEFERVVEGVAREMRDKHGINVSAEDLMKE